MNRFSQIFISNKEPKIAGAADFYYNPSTLTLYYRNPKNNDWLKAIDVGELDFNGVTLEQFIYQVLDEYLPENHYVTQSDVSTLIEEIHATLTENVHGISNTSNLVYTDDERLNNSRNPTTHADTHSANGEDPVSLAVGQVSGAAPTESPTFTGTVVLPSTTSIGDVSSTEIGYLDNVTSAIQTQLNAKAPLASPTFTGIVVADNYDIGLTISNADSILLNFSSETGLYTRTATGAITFTASNYRPGSIKTVRIISGASIRNLNFPAAWVFVGVKPSTILANKTGILTVTSFGITEADCVAAWTVQG